MESWRRSLPVFFAFSAPTIIWLLVFFLIPLGIIWFYSVGENVSLTEIDVTWTLSNYDRIFEPEILTLLWRSLWLAALLLRGKVRQRHWLAFVLAADRG